MNKTIILIISVFIIVLYPKKSFSQGFQYVDPPTTTNALNAGFVKRIALKEAGNNKLYALIDVPSNPNSIQLIKEWNGTEWNIIPTGTQNGNTITDIEYDKSYGGIYYIGYYRRNLFQSTYYIAKKNGNFWDTIMVSPNAAIRKIKFGQYGNLYVSFYKDNGYGNTPDIYVQKFVPSIITGFALERSSNNIPYYGQSGIDLMEEDSQGRLYAVINHYSYEYDKVIGKVFRWDAISYFGAEPYPVVNWETVPACTAALDGNINETIYNGQFNGKINCISSFGTSVYLGGSFINSEGHCFIAYTEGACNWYELGGDDSFGISKEIMSVNAESGIVYAGDGEIYSAGTYYIHKYQTSEGWSPLEGMPILTNGYATDILLDSDGLFLANTFISGKPKVGSTSNIPGTGTVTKYFFNSNNYRTNCVVRTLNGDNVSNLNNTFCPLDSLEISFSSNFNFPCGTVFTAQISNAAGSFSNPTNMGSSTTITCSSSGIIRTRIPNVPYGSNYRIRVVNSTNSAVIPYNDNGLNLQIGFYPPVISSGISGPTGICTDTDYSFSISTSNSNIHSYFWVYSNGFYNPNQSTNFSTSNVITLTPTLDVHSLDNYYLSNLSYSSQDIKVQAVNGCGSSSPVTLDLTFLGSTPPTPTQIILPTTLCENTTINLSTYSDGATSYTWELPEGWTNEGYTTSSFSTTLSNPGTDLILSVTANNNCGHMAPKTLIVSVLPSNPAPSLSISASSTTPCLGEEITFTAISENAPGGTIAWYVNDVFTSETTPFTTNSLNDGDVIKASVFGTLGCQSPEYAISNEITMNHCESSSYFNSLNFDGVDDYVEVASPPNIFNFSGFTIEFWAKRNEINGNKQVILSYGVPGVDYYWGTFNGSDYPFSSNFEIGFNESNQFYYKDGGSSSVVSSTIVDNDWHHYAVTFDPPIDFGNDPSISIAIDGSNTAWSFVPWLNYEYVLYQYLGRSIATNTNNFSGWIDELRVWDSPRTLESINNRKNCEIPMSEYSLALYYKFNEGISDGDNTSIEFINDYGNTSSSVGLMNNFSLIGSFSNFTSGIMDQVCPAAVLTATVTNGYEFCQNDVININVQVDGTLTGDVIVQISDQLGSFDSPIDLGNAYGLGNWAYTLPTLEPGTGYRIRLVSSDYTIIGENNGIDISINSTALPTVTLSQNPSGTICPGSLVTFSTSTTATSPTYTWQINYVTVQTGTNDSYSSLSLNNDDLVLVTVDGLENCASNPSAFLYLSVGGPCLTTYFADTDGDSFGDPSNTTSAVSVPDGYVTNNLDCDDSNALINPNTVWYIDADGDGYGNPSVTTTACTLPAGYSANNTDCNDGNALIYPERTEICGNGVDDNCNGFIDEGCAITNLSASYCNISISSMTQYLAAVAVTGASDYQFEVRNDALSYVQAYTAGSTSTVFRMSFVSGIQNGQTYQVRVKAKTGGVWGGFGPACNITTNFPVTTTSLSASYCGITISSMNQYLAATSVAGATNYRFLVTNSSLGYSQVYTAGTNSPVFRMSFVTGILNGRTYSVQAAAQVGGVWAAYGSPCNITTGFPISTTQLAPAYCGISVTALNQYMSAIVVSGAENYRFEVSNPGLGYLQVYETGSSSSVFRLSNVSGIQNGQTYTIRVAIAQGSLWGSYGPSCNVTTALPVTTTRLAPSYCGITITALNQYLSAVAVSGASNYRYEVTNSSLGYSQVYTSPSSSVVFRMSFMTGLMPGTTYQVRVAAQVGGVWGLYGTSCSITTPSSLRLVESVELAQDPLFKIYPNPFKNSFTLEAMNVEGKLDLKVTDLTGKLYYQSELEFSTLEMGQELVPGMYFVTIKYNSGSKVYKLLKE